MSILSNTCDAMPDGGMLVIASQLLNDMVQIEFTDTGCGMSPEMQKQIFEPFTTEGKSLGTGLGMSIVKEIIDEHQGKVEVESIIGDGITGRIWLPVSQ